MVAMKPGIDAETVVVPAVSGSNATPPAATEVGELLEPAAISTVTLPPVVGVVTNCPTVAGLLLYFV